MAQQSVAQRVAAIPDGVARDELYRLLASMQADLSALTPKLLYGVATYDASSLVDGAGETTTVGVPGAVLGDFVVAVSLGVSTAGITVTGYVSAADTVSVRVQNESGGTLDLASTSLRVLVLPYQNVNSSHGMMCASAVYDTASLVDAAGVTTTVTCTGAAVGDYALVSFGVNLQGLTVTAYVSAANTVSVRIQNESGGTIDLASTTIRVRVIPYATIARTLIVSTIDGVLSGSATYDASVLADAAGETTTVTVTGAVLGDFALVSHGVDLQGITMTANVTAADTVSVRVQNESGGSLDLASSTLRAFVIPKSAFPQNSYINTLP